MSWRKYLILLVFLGVQAALTAQSTLTSPTPGSVLTGSTATFSWSGVTGANSYSLWLGSTGVGSNNLYHSAKSKATSITVSGLPTNGEKIYAQINTYTNGTLHYLNYTYTAFSQAPAAIMQPAPGSILTGSSVTFNWSPGASASGYSLWLGTTGVGSNNLYHSAESTATSLTLGILPTNGQTVYARLNTIVNGTLQHVDYTYTASNSQSALSALTCISTSMTGAGTDSCTVTLNAAAPATGLSVSLLSSNAAVTLPATVTVPANATSAGFMATVTPVAAAQAVTLKASAGSATQTISLQLNASVPTLAVTTSNPSIVYGAGVTFTATISSGPSGSVTFYDGAISIGAATINGKTAALTTASLIAGPHTITANWSGNTNYAAVTSSAITQVVNKATPTITWATPAAITSGTALSATQLNASSTVAGTFAYTPASGAVLKAGAETLSVTFTPTDTTDYSPATATVQLTVGEAAPTITWATPAAITYGTALSATQLNASSTVAGTFAYTPASGTLVKAGAQTLSVTFTPTDTTDYSTATQTVTLTVNPAKPSITWATPAAITYGTALSATQLNASSTVAGTFDYTPASGTLVKAGAQTLSVTFTPTDTTDYSTATQTVTLTVNPAKPSITWATPAAITYGTALSATQLNASSTVAGTFAYTPASGTLVKAGAQTLSVTFTPTDTTDYSTATQTVNFTVNKATPSITWATPAAITLGTLLSATQLNASSTIPGTFVYSPAVGIIPALGSVTLSVTFTPTDSTDYNTATQTVTLTVNLGVATLSINAASVGFGNVILNTLTTQNVTLTSIGTASVTVSSATVTGTGFSLAGSTYSGTLAPGQTATLGVQFDPAATGAATGQLTITSNSSINGNAAIPLSGTGAAATYSVDLTWNAPANSADPVVGFNVYRALNGSSTYQLLNSTIDTQTTYTDTTIQSGQVYDYIVESVDALGVESSPDGPIVLTVP